MKKLFAVIVMSLVVGCSVAAFADPTPQPPPSPWPGPDRRGPIDPIPPPIPPPDSAY